MIFEGFGVNSRLVVSTPVKAERFNEQIDDVLETEGVDFIHLRNGEAGCFIARIGKA